VCFSYGREANALTSLTKSARRCTCWCPSCHAGLAPSSTSVPLCVPESHLPTPCIPQAPAEVQEAYRSALKTVKEEREAAAKAQAEGGGPEGGAAAAGLPPGVKVGGCAQA
jgi:hypothetical protein